MCGSPAKTPAVGSTLVSICAVTLLKTPQNTRLPQVMSPESDLDSALEAGIVLKIIQQLNSTRNILKKVKRQS